MPRGPRSCNNSACVQQSGYIQLEERVRDLEHKDMRVSMVMHNKDPFNRPPHSKILIVVL